MYKPIFSILIYLMAQFISVYILWIVLNLARTETEISNEFGFTLILSSILSIIGTLLIRYQIISQSQNLKKSITIQPLKQSLFTLIPIWEIYQHYRNLEQSFQISHIFSKNYLFLQLAAGLAIVKIIFLASGVLESLSFLQLPLMILSTTLDCYLIWHLLDIQHKHKSESQL
jgi:uncharacterized membrane protein